ncbi:MAG: glutaredoxin 3 [Glomeribacter sp. 1016415]|uniref:Glutaredoxin n=1 Tax=Mycoavidus cysteinexigens TaxID=1553431 RepID=A0A2Z6EXW8_9BURK|nr:glutaredoxin 3 [Mycoavidus cysteinexigens]MCX8566276.1 glutaredoxin 3 [Glomeribacter sp. 1016415]BBE10299.1 glutaredoxin 3 [Mycoavidus cysteinexigens]GLR00716.1 glutaredoxin [Mycoavidus cysteinexigens]
MKKVLMYSKQVCPYCDMAERLLKARGVEHIEKIAIDSDPAKRDEMIQRTGLRTVPQIFIDEAHIGGYDKLAALDRNGELAPLLTGNA